MTNVQTRVERISVVPHGIRGTSIEGPYVIRSRYVQNAVEKDGRGLNLHSLAGWESPGQCELVDILRSNLRHGAVALAGIRSMIRWPTVCRGLQQCGIVQHCVRTLAADRAWKHDLQNQARREARAIASKFHF